MKKAYEVFIVFLKLTIRCCYFAIYEIFLVHQNQSGTNHSYRFTYIFPFLLVMLSRLQMYPTRQRSRADVEKFTIANPFPGEDPHQWPGFSAQQLTYASTLEHGSEIMRSDFKTQKPSPELLLQIETLNKAIEEFVAPAGGNEASRKQLMDLHKADIEKLKVRMNLLEQLDRKHSKMVITAGRIIQNLQDVTSGRIRQIISMISANPNIEITMVPSHMMSQCRYQCYGQGSATAAADQIKRETERLPAANSVAAIRLNTEYLAAAIINIEAIKLEHGKFWEPVIHRANEELAQLHRELLQLQQPPANLPDGQVFNIDQTAVLAKQAQIANKTQEQTNLVQQSQYDSVQQLSDRDLGRSLFNSIPTNSIDGNVTQIREAINRLVFDQTQVHPFSRYTHTVLTLHGQQNQRPPDNTAAAHHPQHHPGYINTVYTASDHHTTEQFDNAQAHAAYARPPSNTRGGTPLHLQICHAYRSPESCQYGQYCPRIHQQATQTNQQGAQRRQSNNHNQGNHQNNYQHNHQGGQGYYHNQGYNQGSQGYHQNQGNNDGGYNNNVGFQHNNDQGRGRSRSPGGRSRSPGRNQRPRNDQGPPPPGNPPPLPSRSRSPSPAHLQQQQDGRGQYPGRGYSPHRGGGSSPHN